MSKRVLGSLILVLTVFLVLPPPVAQADGTIKSGPAVYISTYTGQQILVVDGATGTTAAVQSGTGFAAEDIVVGPDARIYICNPDNGIIQRLKQDGSQLQTIYNASISGASPKPAAPEGPSFKGNDLFFNAKNGDGAWKIAGVAAIGFGGPFPDPTRVTLTGIPQGEGTAFGSDGNLLIVDRQGNRVLKFDFSGPTLSTFIQNPGSCAGVSPSGCVLDNPIGITVNSAGDIFVANAGGSLTEIGINLQNINHFGSGGSFVETYASFSGSDHPFFLESDALGRLYVVTNDLNGTGGKVWRIDSPGGLGNLFLLVALASVEGINGVGSTDQAVGLGLGRTAFLTQHYTTSPTLISRSFDFVTDQVNISFTAVGTAFDLTVFREEIPYALLGLQLPTSGPNLHFPCVEYDSDQGTCVVYEEGVGPTLDPLPPGDFTGPVGLQVFYSPVGTIGTPVLAHAEDPNLQSPVDQYDANELTGFTLAIIPPVDPAGMNGGSGGLSRHVALNTPLVQTDTKFCGFESPAPPGRTFKKPQTIAIKFKIAAPGGSCALGPFVTNAFSQLWLFNMTTNTFVTPSASGNSSAPNAFHVDTTSGENIFNLSTKKLATGTYIFTMTSNSVSAQFSFFILN